MDVEAGDSPELRLLSLSGGAGPEGSGRLLLLASLQVLLSRFHGNGNQHQ